MNEFAVCDYGTLSRLIRALPNDYKHYPMIARFSTAMGSVIRKDPEILTNIGVSMNPTIVPGCDESNCKCNHECTHVCTPPSNTPEVSTQTECGVKFVKAENNLGTVQCKNDGGIDKRVGILDTCTWDSIRDYCAYGSMFKLQFGDYLKWFAYAIFEPSDHAYKVFTSDDGTKIKLYNHNGVLGVVSESEIFPEESVQTDISSGFYIMDDNGTYIISNEKYNRLFIAVISTINSDIFERIRNNKCECDSTTSGSSTTVNTTIEKPNGIKLVKQEIDMGGKIQYKPAGGDSEDNYSLGMMQYCSNIDGFKNCMTPEYLLRLSFGSFDKWFMFIKSDGKQYPTYTWIDESGKNLTVNFNSNFPVFKHDDPIFPYYETDLETKTGMYKFVVDDSESVIPFDRYSNLSHAIMRKDISSEISGIITETPLYREPYTVSLFRLDNYIMEEKYRSHTLVSTETYDHGETIQGFINSKYLFKLQIPDVIDEWFMYCGTTEEAGENTWVARSGELVRIDIKLCVLICYFPNRTFEAKNYFTDASTGFYKLLDDSSAESSTHNISQNNVNKLQSTSLSAILASNLNTNKQLASKIEELKANINGYALKYYIDNNGNGGTIEDSTYYYSYHPAEPIDHEIDYTNWIIRFDTVDDRIVYGIMLTGEINSERQVICSDGVIRSIIFNSVEQTIAFDKNALQFDVSNLKSITVYKPIDDFHCTPVENETDEQKEFRMRLANVAGVIHNDAAMNRIRTLEDRIKTLEETITGLSSMIEALQ